MWRDSGHAAGNPGQWIDRIMEIRSNYHLATTTYSDLFTKFPRSQTLHEACESVFIPIQVNQFNVLKKLDLLIPTATTVPEPEASESEGIL